MTRVKAIIFDMDGVIVNSSRIYVDAIREALEKRGYDIGTAFVAERIIAHIGSWVDAVLPENANERGKALNEIIEEVKESTAKASEGVVYQEGMEKVLETLSRDSVLFLVTNSGSKLTEKILGKRHLKRFFKEIVTSDGFGSKENAMEHIIENNGLRKNEVTYVGDTEKDILCARKVGCRAVILYTPSSWNYGKYESLKKAGPDAIVDNLEDLLKVLQEA
jgi:phosphoglycolate phosphatase